ncbi:MAG: hypothetical protein C4555_03205 [Dehalococcoidia bacterium]|nr:MAG: hypothetical protein C4555_03205 [Dehalococcoidia bacterium]
MNNSPWIVKLLEELRGYEGKDRMQDFRTLTAELKDHIRPIAHKTLTIPTLDLLSGGFQEGELVILGGASNEGKTLLMLSLIDALQEQGMITACFSFEQTIEQIAEKFNYAPPIFWIPRIADYETKYDREIEELKHNRNTYIGKLPSLQMQWLFLKFLEMQAKSMKPQAVFIDYLHVLMGKGYDNKVWALGDVMIELKQMALQFRMVIFVICHTTKESMNREEPSLADLRDSGWIVNVPDIILLLWRKLDKSTKEPGPLSILKIAKHRRKGNAKNKKIELMMNERGMLIEHSGEWSNAAD